LKKIKKILIIIQRSNGDVFLSTSLIKKLFESFDSPQIDLLVNKDTHGVANLIPNINSIFTFSYSKKKNSRLEQEKKIFSTVFRKYDLSINLTASDRSVIYALLSSNKAISAIEEDRSKSWWKKILLYKYYVFDANKHILLNNLEPLNLLKIDHENIQKNLEVSCIDDVRDKLAIKGISKFIVFHPSAQYEYKMYPQHLRDQLLLYLSQLEIPILITGGNNQIDKDVKRRLPKLPNIFDYIGDTTLEELVAINHLSAAYIGMDTFNMHLAASESKPIFAIFGPTNLKMWSPWSNKLKTSAVSDSPKQIYDKITIFQANMACVACGKAGCGDKHLKSDCLYNIDPLSVFNEVKKWYQSL
jgi:heptosyltransferase III